MADKKRLLDVWILESNTVYREVPFAVVTDWLQQGRLLSEDRVRQPGGKNWHVIENVPAFVPYLPRAEPLTVEDKAEALEPVDLGFQPTGHQEEEDQDVDMIPLIDISLVLLIFFMMTAAVNPEFLSPINTPGAKHQLGTITADSFWIGIDTKSGAGKIEKDSEGKPLPWFSLGKEMKKVHDPTTDAGEVVDALEKLVADREGEIKVRLRADRNLPIETIKGITLGVQELEARMNRSRGQGKARVQFVVTGEVSEPKGK